MEESYFYIKLFPLCDENIFTFNFHSNRDGKKIKETFLFFSET